MQQGDQVIFFLSEVAKITGFAGHMKRLKGTGSCRQFRTNTRHFERAKKALFWIN